MLLLFNVLFQDGSWAAKCKRCIPAWVLSPWQYWCSSSLSVSGNYAANAECIFSCDVQNARNSLVLIVQSSWFWTILWPLCFVFISYWLYYDLRLGPVKARGVRSVYQWHIVSLPFAFRVWHMLAMSEAVIQRGTWSVGSQLVCRQ